MAPCPRNRVRPVQNHRRPHRNCPPSVRAQILATEHWSLLASRSTTQGEVLTRISMFLTFTSASLLSVALVGNATQFSDAFRAFALTILCIDLVVGLLTHIRVMSVGMEDLMYVLAMNRLRAAYLTWIPGSVRTLWPATTMMRQAPNGPTTSLAVGPISASGRQQHGVHGFR